MIGNFIRNMNLESDIENTSILKFSVKYFKNSKHSSHFFQNFQGKFLVACCATLHPALLVRPSVSPSVRWSVRRLVRLSVTLYFFWVFAVFGLTVPAQMIE